MDIQKPVRELLRAADIVLDRLKSGHPFSEQEIMMLQGYNTRIAACLTGRAAHRTQVQSNGPEMGSYHSDKSGTAP
jgi:hypothetical protein